MRRHTPPAAAPRAPTAGLDTPSAPPRGCAPPRGVHDQREPALQSSPGSEGVDPQTEHPREGVPLGVRLPLVRPQGGAPPLGVRAPWGCAPLGGARLGGKLPDDDCSGYDTATRGGAMPSGGLARRERVEISNSKNHKYRISDFVMFGRFGWVRCTSFRARQDGNGAQNVDAMKKFCRFWTWEKCKIFVRSRVRFFAVPRVHP